jgi:hydroxymethylglutaryl-CoA reductase (NADPH)
MPAPHHYASKNLERILQDSSLEQKIAELRPRSPETAPLPPGIPAERSYSEKAVGARRLFLQEQGAAVEQLAGRDKEISSTQLKGNIENFIGFAKVPVGVIGPLRINGPNAHGDFYVPLATTEGALVASYNRGAKIVSQAGGVTALCLTEAVLRSPCFVFDNLIEAGHFLAWVLPRFETLQEIISRTSRYCRIEDLKTAVLGKEVYLIFEFTTGDAAGQNMVTLATEAICRDLLEKAPVKPRHFFLEANLSGDKKASMLAFTFARGKKVVAEATIPREILQKHLRAEPADLVRYWQVAIMGGIQSGSIGVHGHYANALAALFIACGQDVACVSEAATGLTRMDVTSAGDLYLSVSLPNLIVGTIGGGTALPTARECLQMMDCYGAGRARKFAEICAATVLAGELSLIGAITTGEYGQAHALYGRKTRGPDGNRHE